MRQTPILLALLLFVPISCGVPVDDEPGKVTSPLIDRAEITESDSADGESRNEYIYLFDKDNKLSPVLRKVPSVDLKVTDLINELTADLLPIERQANLSTTVPIGLSLTGVTQDNDLVIINFDAGGLEVIEGDELAKALAQIVWTLTETGDLDSIIISIEGEIKTWPTPNSGDQQLLRRIQFMSYAPEVTLGIAG
ncbi:hypothetical protein CL649_03400 [bacterium]|nr:hypothetical protein [bacterium]|tara:strand:- start:3867 stop:4451 length:585 start_codon:yes stop_codon:yes gene_type:complete